MACHLQYKAKGGTDDADEDQGTDFQRRDAAGIFFTGDDGHQDGEDRNGEKLHDGQCEDIVIPAEPLHGNDLGSPEDGRQKAEHVPEIKAKICISAHGNGVDPDQAQDDAEHRLRGHLCFEKDEIQHRYADRAQTAEKGSPRCGGKADAEACAGVAEEHEQAYDDAGLEQISVYAFQMLPEDDRQQGSCHEEADGHDHKGGNPLAPVQRDKAEAPGKPDDDQA